MSATICSSSVIADSKPCDFWDFAWVLWEVPGICISVCKEAHSTQRLSSGQFFALPENLRAKTQDHLQIGLVYSNAWPRTDLLIAFCYELTHLHTRPNRIFTTFIHTEDSSLHHFDSPFPTIRRCIFCVIPTRRKSMDWIYLLLTLAFFGLSVLLIRGIEKLGRPS